MPEATKEAIKSKKTLEQIVEEINDRLEMLEGIVEKSIVQTERNAIGAVETLHELTIPKDSFKIGDKVYRHKLPLIWHNGSKIITEDATDEDNALIVKNYPGSVELVSR
jgi:hypothetical protein